MATLIISSELVIPPSEKMAVRTLTLFCHEYYKLDILLETESYFKDAIYKYMLLYGMMDYIDQIVEDKEKIKGLRLTNLENSVPITIKTKDITLENQLNLLGRIKVFST